MKKEIKTKGLYIAYPFEYCYSEIGFGEGVISSYLLTSKPVLVKKCGIGYKNISTKDRYKALEQVERQIILSAGFISSKTGVAIDFLKPVSINKKYITYRDAEEILKEENPAYIKK